MITSIGIIEFFQLDDTDPMVRLMVNEVFHEIDPVERVKFLMAASQVAFAFANQIANENPDCMDEIVEVMQSTEIEPLSKQLN